MTRKHRIVPIVVASLLLVGGTAQAGQADLSDFSATGSSLVWSPAQGDEMTLRIATPDGRIADFVVQGQSVLDVAELAEALGNTPDGLYTWELRPSLHLDQAQMGSLDDNTRGLVKSPFASDDVQSGTFRLDNGVLVGDRTEEASTGTRVSAAGELDHAVTAAPGELDFATQAFVDTDVIVDGSLCVGTDCNTSGENFGFDTQRLKENNLRIHFDDTSSSGSFPNVDWRLTANDSNNGGANYFSIDDVTNNKRAFVVEATAPNDTIVADSNGRLGVGTASPVLQIHTVDGNTPGLRLEQDGSSGFSSRIWDVAANEINFFVRDITNGSALPFRIYAGTAGNTMMLRDGRVALGHDSPSDQLHLKSSSTPSAGQILVQNTGTTVEQRQMLRLENNGFPLMSMLNSDSGQEWTIRSQNNGLAFNDPNSAASQVEMRIDSDGNVYATQFVASSSKALKENYRSLDSRDMLDRVLGLTIEEWNYKGHDDSVRHIGPYAEDFHATFGLNDDSSTIPLADMNGIAFAAIQGLNDVVEEKDDEIRRLEQRIESLEQMVEALVEAQK